MQVFYLKTPSPAGWWHPVGDSRYRQKEMGGAGFHLPTYPIFFITIETPREPLLLNIRTPKGGVLIEGEIAH
jgi:hypothetical protein